MADRFEGFPARTFSWFEGLEADNTKAYFTATRTVYDRDVRGALTALLEELSERFGGQVRVFRQQRDLRRSADRTPYKTRTYGVLQGPALYADLSLRGLYAGTGYHALDAGQLARYRAAVLDEAAGGDLEGARGSGGGGRRRGGRPKPADRAARRRARPPPDRPAPAPRALCRRGAAGRLRDRARGGAGARRRRLDRRAAADRLARRARRSG
jgi:hypothetical protein